MKRAFGILAWLLVSCTADAGGLQADDAISIMGADVSCGTVLGSVNEDFYQGWLAGFYSGTNMARQRGGMSHMDATALTKSITNYCEEHPLDSLMDAAHHLDSELGR